MRRATSEMASGSNAGRSSPASASRLALIRWERSRRSLRSAALASSSSEGPSPVMTESMRRRPSKASCA